MTYEQTLRYLYEQLPMFSRIGAAAYKADLHNTIELCRALGDPQHSFKSIHVAGTNGKGSTSHMLAAILQKAGYKTGLYTSPHIKAFGERIRVNGEMIDPQFVTSFVERTQQLSDAIQPSFFELTVAMAFDYFSSQQVDIAVIETGLGGRLDSTNVITPVLSVITNIGYDHMNLLGNTLEQIASEKAGIIKKNIPVVIGEILPETMPVFSKKANELDAPLVVVPEYLVTEYIDPGAGLLLCNIKNIKTGIVEKLRLDLTGLYQVKNAATVLAAVEQLRKAGFTITEHALHEGLENVRSATGLAGRWDVAGSHPTVIHDVAHNAEGITQVIQQLKYDYPNAGLHFVLGFVNDKDLEKIIQLFPANAHYYFTNAHLPRALAHDQLKHLAAENNLQGESYDNVNAAITAAKQQAAADDVIMVCGSFFIIGEIK